LAIITVGDDGDLVGPDADDPTAPPGDPRPCVDRPGAPCARLAACRRGNTAYSWKIDACDDDGPAATTVFVSRVGDGSGTLTTSSTAPVFLEERTIESGELVRTIPLPTATVGSQNAISCVGGGITEANIQRSKDGRYIMLSGYATPPGTPDPRNNQTIKRVIARVDAAGNVDTSTLIDTLSTPRGVASIDGTAFWITGVGHFGTTNGGMYYVTFGNTGAASQLFSPPTTVRIPGIFFGQLYAGLVNASPNVNGIATVGTGLPTGGPVPVTTMTGFNATNAPSIAGYAFVRTSADPDGMGNRIYAANDSNDTNGVNVRRYSVSAGTVTYETAWHPVLTGVNVGSRGLAVVQRGDVFTVLATTTDDVVTTGNRLVKIEDDGTTMTPVVTPIAATGSANARYRGVAPAPVP
jgi:hypothetical protein